MNYEPYLKHIYCTSNGEKAWYVAEMLSLVMEVNLATNSFKCLFEIPGDTPICTYRTVYYHKNKLYVIPYNSQILYIYDLDNNSIDQVNIGNGSNSYATGCISRNEYLYIFGATARICKYNTNTGIIKSIDVVPAEAGMNYSPAQWFWTEAFLSANDIYIPFCDAKELIKIDAYDNCSYIRLGNGGTCEALSILQNEKGFRSIFLLDNCIHMEKYGENGGIEEQAIISSFPSLGEKLYSHASFVNNGWLLLPYRSKSIFFISDGENKARMIYDLGIPEKRFEGHIGSAFNCISNTARGCLCAIDLVLGDMIVITEELKITDAKLEFSVEALNQLKELNRNKVLYGSHMIEESEVVGVADLIDFIK